MVFCNHQSSHHEAQEVFMSNNVVDSIIASIIFGLLSTVLGFVLQAHGFSAQASIIIALLVLLALMLLFLAVRRYYPNYSRWLTQRLLDKALSVKEPDRDSTEFKQKIIERVLRENPALELQQNDAIIEFPNQEACEAEIANASRNAGRAKILTIRGTKE